MSTVTEPQSPVFPDVRSCQALQQALCTANDARQQYLRAAQAMEDAQLHVIAHAFRYTAAQEKEHAAIFSGLLSSLGGHAPRPEPPPQPLPRDPLDFLHAFIRREEAQAARHLPHYARAAAEEGFPRISAAFARISETEARHARRFRQYAEALENGTLFREAQPVSWLCLHCGELHTGCEPPAHCPSCGRNRGHFIRSNYVPFALEG